ncbi:MAG: murein biosynthesis integral membrane protein MurJ [Ilumatobacteraceae bacterium]
MAGLLRSNLAVASGTALSRLTGVARVAVLGAVLGTPSAVADAYDLANGTPNMLYELLLGGILSSTLVPVLTRLRETDDDEGTSAVVTVSVLALAALTALAVLAAPLVFRLYSLLTADGIDVAQYRAVGTALSRLFLVQIFWYGLNALGTGLLASRRRFFAAAWSSALSNLVIIASLLLVPSLATAPLQLTDVLDNGALRWLLGGGATIGIAVMALALGPSVARCGVPIRFRPDLRHPAVRSLSRMSAWTLGYVAANQVALVVIRNLLRGGDGSAFAYSRAFLWFMLPHAVLAMPIITTFQPDLAAAWVRGDRDELARRTTVGVRLVALLTLPAGVGLFVLREPLIGAVFQHGSATAADSATTARALGGFALGLTGFSVYLFVLRAFYAREDARTPFWINMAENTINIVLAIVLVGRYGLLGLGASFAIAYVVSAVIALVVLEKKVREIAFRPMFDGVAQLALAAAVMGVVVRWISSRVGGTAGGPAALRLAVGTVTGIVVYGGLLAATRSTDLRALLPVLSRGRAGRRDG